jgi:MFS family permease
MTYLGEFRQNARALAAAAIGSGSGLMVAAFTTSIFSPYLLKEFGWSRAQFSLMGLTMFSTLLVLPLIGRLTDRLGVRPVALIGALLLPLCFIGYSLQTGSFWMILALSAATLAVGSLTSPVVYCRLIAESFDRARGLALFVVTGVPALMGAILPRALVAINDHWGWRVGYRVLAAYFLVGGLVAVMLTPRHERGLDHRADAAASRAAIDADRQNAFREIVGKPVFWLISGAILLCALPTSLHASQMMLMLLDTGIDKTSAANAISAFALGSLIGRAACGLALDRFPAPVVAAVSMVLPALGYALIASSRGSVPMVTLSMLLIGLSYGADADLPSFLVARYFRLEIFSSALSLTFCATLFGSASGALLLSALLLHYKSFAPFLYLMSGTVLAGSLLFLCLPRRRAPINQPAEQFA